MYTYIYSIKWGNIEQSYTFYGNLLLLSITAMLQGVFVLDQSLKVSLPHPKNFFKGPYNLQPSFFA